MRKIVFVLAIPCNLLFGQAIHHMPVVYYTSLEAYSQHFRDVVSYTANVAALADIKQFSGGVFAEKKFLLNELNSYSLAVGIPFHSGSCGITARYLGFSDLNETQVAAAYAKDLDKVDVGIQFNYNMLKVAGYGSDQAISVAAGAIWQVSDRLSAGVSLVNPIGGKFSKDKSEKMAAIYRVGLGYEPSRLVLVALEIIKEEDRPVTVHAGIQYSVAEKFLLRGGIIANVGTPYLGGGWCWKNYRVDATASYHPQLGITPGLLFIFSGKKKVE